MKCELTHECYPTFIYGQYYGDCHINKIVELKSRFLEEAFKVRHKASHIIYCYYDYDDNDNRVYHFDILPKTENEFDTISRLSNYFIYAMHRG